MAKGEHKYDVDNVFVDGEPYSHPDRVLPKNIKWIHVIPDETGSGDPKKATMYCFSEEKKDPMLKWLDTRGLLELFLADEKAHETVVEHNRRRLEVVEKARAANTEPEPDSANIEQFNNNRESNKEFLELTKDIKPSEKDYREKLRALIKNHVGHTAYVFSKIDFCKNDPVLDQNNVMLVNERSTIFDLSLPPPPYPDWDNKIKSAIVKNGCLRLFDQRNLGNPHLFLYGPAPNGNPAEYPDLAIYAFSGVASSLQHTI